MSEIVMPAPNAYWGRKSGAVSPAKGEHFPQPNHKGGSNNSGARGNKTRWYAGRALRQRLGKHGGVKRPTKGG